MNEIELKAKGRGRFLAVATADDGGITVRLDRHDDPAFWCEVRIGVGQLLALLAACDLPSETCAVE